MQLLWLFSAFTLIGAVASASGDCALLPAFLEENDEGEPKIAAAMKEECALSFTGAELTECRKCANKIAAAIVSAENLEERITKIYGEVMVYTNNGANTTRFSFVNSMLRKYWGSFDQLQACAEMSAIVVNRLLLGAQITPSESYQKAEQCDSSCTQNPLCVGSSYFPNQTCLLFSSVTGNKRSIADGVRSYFKDYTALCKTTVYGCPQGWTHFDEAQSCYRNLLTKSNFSTAMKMCEHEEAEVVLPKSNAESNFVIGAFADPVYGNYWIGMRLGHCPWVDAMDGSKINFTNWVSYGPDAYEECVYSDSTIMNGQWRNENCTSSRFVVCKKDEITQ